MDHRLVRTKTTTALLRALADLENEQVWVEFDRRYRPILCGLARRCGLGEEDAADAAQQTLFEFARDYRAGKYKQERGRLRSWLMGIARHRMRNAQRACFREAGWRGDSALRTVSDDDELDRIWDDEQERAIIQRSVGLLRERTNFTEGTLQAFEMLIFDGLPANEVASAFGKSKAEVYRIKNRVSMRLREIVTEVRQSYEEPSGDDP